MQAQQLRGAVVFPALREARNTCLQRNGVFRAERCCAVGAHDVVDTRQRTVGQHRREFQRLALQCIHELGTHLDPQFGVVTVSWHEYLRRNEAPERVAAQKYPGALAFLQPQNADGVFGQRGAVDLEQFVARITVQNGLQGLGGVTVGHHAGGGHYLGRTAAYPRYVGDGGRVGGRGVQTQKAVFTHHNTCRIKTLDSHVVQPGRPVHGGTCHCLGDQQQVVGVNQCHGLGRQLCLRGVGRTPQDAQAGVGLGHQPHLCGITLQIVVACTQESEMPVLQPMQEVNVFGARCFRQGRVLRQKANFAQPFQHGGPVLHRGAHVAQHAFEFSRQGLTLLLRDDAVALDGNERGDRGVRRVHHSRIDAQGTGDAPVRRSAHRQHGVDDPVRGAPARIDRHGHRVDQERHILLHDLDHTVVADETVLLQAGVEHPHTRERRERGRLQQAPVRVGQGEQGGGAAQHNFLRIGVLVIRRDKADHGLRASSGMGPGIGDQIVQGGCCHGVSSTRKDAEILCVDAPKAGA